MELLPYSFFVRRDFLSLVELQYMPKGYGTRVSTIAITNFAIELTLRSMVHNSDHTGDPGQMTRDCRPPYLCEGQTPELGISNLTNIPNKMGDFVLFLGIRLVYVALRYFAVGSTRELKVYL